MFLTEDLEELIHTVRRWPGRGLIGDEFLLVLTPQGSVVDEALHEAWRALHTASGRGLQVVVSGAAPGSPVAPRRRTLPAYDVLWRDLAGAGLLWGLKPGESGLGCLTVLSSQDQVDLHCNGWLTLTNDGGWTVDPDRLLYELAELGQARTRFGPGFMDVHGALQDVAAAQPLLAERVAAFTEGLLLWVAARGAAALLDLPDEVEATVDLLAAARGWLLNSR